MTHANAPLSKSDVEDLARRFNRWGRWGPDDELGALNFIDPAAVARASALVRTGEVVSCAMAYDQSGPQRGERGRTNPMRYMLYDGGDIHFGVQDDIPGLRFADDVITMPLQSGTHWDAFSHIFYDGHMYNGFGLESVTSQGARHGALEVVRERLVGRGLLLDIPRQRGVEWLEPGEGIDSAELEACANAQSVEVRRGDILLVRTGHLGRRRAHGWQDYAGGDAPGLSLDSAQFICDREVAAIATDTWGCEVRPNETDDIYQPLHVVLLVNAGVMFGEMFDLDALAESCARDARYEFLFVAAPLPFTGAVGGPLNPIAIR
jgi:kynurenine formamidase